MIETNDTVSLREIWLRAFNHVRTTVDIATVWLAMQAAVPITIDGHLLVVGLSSDDQYLATNLKSHQATTAIEEAVQQITGRVLALELIEGTTLADWQAQKPAGAGEIEAPTAPSPVFAAPSPPPIFAAPRPTPPPTLDTQTPDPAPSWEKLTERLQQTYKTSPVKFAQGQARFILRAVRTISETMDALMPPPGAPSDDVQERSLTKVLERLGNLINLDPLFLALEVMRYRQAQGKETF